MQFFKTLFCVLATVGASAQIGDLSDVLADAVPQPQTDFPGEVEAFQMMNYTATAHPGATLMLENVFVDLAANLDAFQVWDEPTLERDGGGRFFRWKTGNDGVWGGDVMTWHKVAIWYCPTADSDDRYFYQSGGTRGFHHGMAWKHDGYYLHLLADADAPALIVVHVAGGVVTARAFRPAVTGDAQNQ